VRRLTSGFDTIFGKDAQQTVFARVARCCARRLKLLTRPCDRVGGAAVLMAAKGSSNKPDGM